MSASAVAGEGALAGEKQDAAVPVLDHRDDGCLRAVERAIEDLLSIAGRQGRRQRDLRPGG